MTMTTKDVSARFGLASERQVFANKDDAVHVAEIFMRHPHIHGVEFFGRTAREGRGHDLDLILITGEDRGAAFIRKVNERLRLGGSPLETEDLTLQRVETYNTPAVRGDAAVSVLGGNFRELLAEARRSTVVELDIFVFWRDWRNFLHVLQKSLRCKDPNFMRNIARDAVKIA